MALLLEAYGGGSGKINGVLAQGHLTVMPPGPRTELLVIFPVREGIVKIDPRGSWHSPHLGPWPAA